MQPNSNREHAEPAACLPKGNQTPRRTPDHLERISKMIILSDQRNRILSRGLATATMILFSLSGITGMARAAPPSNPGCSADRPPNFVILVADDLGWADLPSYGHPFHETPNLDALAAAGVRFTAAYASGPVCSPTRASIQTGRHQARYGLTAHIPGHWRPFEKLAEPPPALALPSEAQTLAELLKPRGYRTGYYGKWHLGGKGFGPADQGYDDALEFSNHVYPSRRQAKSDQPPRRGPDVLADQAVNFINRESDQPFLLQVHYFAVHIPLDADPDLEAKYRAKPQVEGRPIARPDYAALLEEMDNSIGRILEALNQRGLDANTWVLFLSDNGGLERESGGWPGTSNRPLRDQKGTLYEGGIRIPMIARIPGLAQPGTVIETPVVTYDLAPTLLAAAAARPPRPARGGGGAGGGSISSPGSIIPRSLRPTARSTGTTPTITPEDPRARSNATDSS